MLSHAERPVNRNCKTPVATIVRMAQAVALGAMLLASVAAPSLAAQSASTQAPAAPPTANQANQAPATASAPSQATTPQWQIDAGGKMEFDIASVKQDTAPQTEQTVNSNIPLGPMDMFTPTGGLLSSTNFPLSQYMIFAYKFTPAQFQAVQSQLPKWANTDRYDIQARASIPNPTKDQFRLMMQALLADRFKLKIHYDTKQVPVMALVLDKPGKLGPHLQPHPGDLPCPTDVPPPNSGPGAPPTVAGGFPVSCGSLQGWLDAGRVHVGGRNMTLGVFATELTGLADNGIDRSVLDKTGLAGKYDFIFDFALQINGPLPPGFDFTPDESAPTFMEALKQQLGLKLESQTGPVPVVVVDHVEQPTEN
jgi:uncharacterized protein (TIGR03435 family)